MITIAVEVAARRVARMLRAAVEHRDDVWVSCEIAVRDRARPTVALRPAVAVIGGPMPYHGVVDDPPLLVIELHLDRVARWQALGIPVWVPQPDAVIVAGAAGQRVVRRATGLVMPGVRGARVPLEELQAAVTQHSDAPREHA